MASNLTGQVRNLAEVTIAVGERHLSRRSPSTCAANFQLKEAINTMVDQLRRSPPR